MVGKLVSRWPIEKKDLEVVNLWKNKEEGDIFLGSGDQPLSPDQQEKWLDFMIDQIGSNRRFMVIVNDRALECLDCMLLMNAEGWYESLYS